MDTIEEANEKYYEELKSQKDELKKHVWSADKINKHNPEYKKPFDFLNPSLEK